MVIPKSLRGRIVAWTHHYLVHPGGTRLEKTLSKLCTWPNMARDIQAYTKTCRKCQLCKTNTKKYGQMPTKEAEPPIPWNRVNVDLIGPYDVKVKGTRNNKIQLRANDYDRPSHGMVRGQGNRCTHCRMLPKGNGRYVVQPVSQTRIYWFRQWEGVQVGLRTDDKEVWTKNKARNKL